MSLVSSANLTVGQFSFLYLHSAGYRENKKEESSLGSTSNGVQSITLLEMTLLEILMNRSLGQIV